MKEILKRPLAWLPIALSALGLVIVLVHLAVYGPMPQAPFGPAARLFQLIVVAQIPLILSFASVWLPRERAWARSVLRLQVAVALLPIVLVFVLGL